jgi:hypothetical protein
MLAEQQSATANYDKFVDGNCGLYSVGLTLPLLANPPLPLLIPNALLLQHPLTTTGRSTSGTFWPDFNIKFRQAVRRLLSDCMGKQSGFQDLLFFSGGLWTAGIIRALPETAIYSIEICTPIPIIITTEVFLPVRFAARKPYFWGERSYAGQRMRLRCRFYLFMTFKLLKACTGYMI